MDNLLMVFALMFALALTFRLKPSEHTEAALEDEWGNLAFEMEREERW